MSDAEIASAETEPTPTSIEREIEETRERLAGTIDELLHRSNPKTIVGRQVALLKGYFVDVRTGEPRTENFIKAAAGVAAAVAVVVVLRKVTR